MSATLIAISSAPQVADPKSNIERLNGQVSEAVEELTALEGWHRSTFNEAHGRTPSERAFIRLTRASSRCEAAYDNRIKTLERRLRRVLANDELPEALRTELVACVYGSAAPSRAPITDTERHLVEQYRAMDDAARQMVRTLFARLATSTVAADMNADVNDGGAR